MEGGDLAVDVLELVDALTDAERAEIFHDDDFLGIGWPWRRVPAGC